MFRSQAVNRTSALLNFLSSRSQNKKYQKEMNYLSSLLPSAVLGPAAVIQVKFNDSKTLSLPSASGAKPLMLKKIILYEGGGREELFIFDGTDDIEGEVTVTPQVDKLEHFGVKIELIGQIEPFYDKARSSEFTSLVRELDTPGVMTVSKTYSFKFSDVEKPYESYNGLNIRLRYFVRVTITRQYSPNVEKEQDFWIQNINTITDTDQNPSIKMEVGIEDCLHIEFIFNKTKYFLQDAIIGKVYFMLVRIRIKKMEIAIIKREAIGEEGAPAMKTESETVAKYEIMDGCPVRGEAIPVRMFLENFSLSPTYRNVNNQFSVKYFLNLVLFDEEGRRYFKQQEIILWRRTHFAPTSSLDGLKKTLSI